MPQQNFYDFTKNRLQLDLEDMERMSEICRLVPGYSDAKHALFFKRLFACTSVSRILILGVYFGRDIVLMIEAGRRAGRRLSITGIDKFSDDACADWPEEVRGGTWEQAGFGRPPSLEEAQAAIDPFKGDATVTLIRARDEVFMANCRETFDLIYLDTSHDYETVCRQLHQAAKLLAPNGLLAGDDYSDRGTWGVRRALATAAPGHAVFADWLWIAAADQVLSAKPALALS